MVQPAGSATMRAVQFSGRGRVDVVDAPRPRAERTGVRVALEWAAICGSDLHWLFDSPEERYPYHTGGTGHECVGIVRQTDDDRLPVGSRALVLPPRYDGFAEEVVLASEHALPVPPALEPRTAVLAQQLGTVLYCFRKVPNVTDRRVLVIGQGPAGLLFTMLAARAGAREVIGVDLVEHRLALAHRLGASLTFDAGIGSVEAQVAEATSGEMADIVIEAVGKEETVNDSIRSVARGGQVVVFGVPKQPRMSVEMDRLLRKNAHLVTSVGAQSEPGLNSFRLALRLLAENRLDVTPLVSHEFPLEKAPLAFELAESMRDGAVKVLLDLGSPAR